MTDRIKGISLMNHRLIETNNGYKIINIATDEVVGLIPDTTDQEVVFSSIITMGIDPKDVENGWSGEPV